MILAILCAVTLGAGQLTCTLPMPEARAMRLLAQCRDMPATGGLVQPFVVRQGDAEWQAARAAGPRDAAMRVERIGLATLYLADNVEVVPTLPRHDALIGDPPYGQKHKTNVMGVGGKRHRASKNWGGRIYPTGIHGDESPFDPAPWIALCAIVLLWGAHRFADRLPPGTWLVWDKVPTGKVRHQGDGEAAWLSGDPRPMRLFRLLWDGLCVGSAAHSEVTAGQQREHPTQKPVALMEWCLDQAHVTRGMSVLDPWMGAGSTGIATVKRGCPFTGIEIEPLYFDAACRRIEAAQRQGDMIRDVLPRAMQEAML